MHNLKKIKNAKKKYFLFILLKCFGKNINPKTHTTYKQAFNFGKIICSRPAVLNLGYEYPWGYASSSQGVCKIFKNSKVDDLGKQMGEQL